MDASWTKYAAVVISPLGVVLLLLLAAVAKGRRSLVVAAILVLYLASTRMVSDPLLRSLEAGYDRGMWREQPAHDAIVVLGGSVKYAATTPDHLEWGDAADRFETGLKAYAAGAAPRLIFTGNRLPLCPPDVTEPDMLSREAVRRGVPATAILTPGVALNTAGDAQTVRALSTTERPLKRLILVTSAWHLPRATFLFREAGFQVTPAPCDFRVAPGGGLSAWRLLPSVDGLTLTSLALREHLGLIQARMSTWSR